MRAARAASFLRSTDTDTVLTKKNVCKIQHNLENQQLSVSNIKKSLKYCVEEDQMWRVSFILDIFQVRSGKSVLDGFDEDDVTNLNHLNRICTNSMCT